MLFKKIALLGLAVPALAHPHPYRHLIYHRAPSAGGVAAPTGGKYGMGNATYPYGPTGTGYGTGTASYPTQSAYGSDDKKGEVDSKGSKDGSRVDNKAAEDGKAPAAIPNNNAAGCNAGSQQTTTIYETELVTMTVINANTETVNAATANSATSSAAAAQEAGSRIEYTGMVATPDVAGASAEGPAAAVPEPASANPSPAEAPAPDALAAEPPAASPVETAVSPTDASEPAVEPAPASSPAFSSAVSPAGAFYETAPTPAADPAPAPEAASPPATGSSGSKRGLAYNSADATKAFSGGSMSWAYNWAASPAGALGSGIEYVPMLWGQKAFGGWEAAAKSALAAGAKNLLSFNEPDHFEQANMDSATAAKAHIEKMNPYSGQARIGSPAVTNGGPSGGTDGMGLAWLANFFDKCGGKCKVDFLNIHWYDSASNVPYFKKHIQDAIDLAKKNGVDKIWLTEFAAAGSDAEIAKFLGEVLPWLDSNAGVERYAYFMCSEGKLVNGGALSAIGKAFAG